MRDIFIIGAGGVGKEVAFIIEQVNIKTHKWNILGIVDDDKSLWGTEINGYKVLGGLSVLEKFKNQDIKVIYNSEVLSPNNRDVVLCVTKKGRVERVNLKIREKVPNKYVDN